jgi:hypothetical protein
MDSGSHSTGTAEAEARAQLIRDAASLTGEPHERRREALMEWAEHDLGLDRAYTEQIYKLAEEEELEPILAFQLIRSGLGVRELEAPEQDMDEATQQSPPEWVAEDAVELDDIALERGLRATFRRLRSHMDDHASPAAAVTAFLDEPDIGLVRLR